MSMHTFLLTAGLALASGAVAAQSYEIRYQDAYTSNHQIIANDYGSIAGVIDLLHTSPGGANLLFWADSYSGRPAAYSPSSVGLVTLTPAAGLTVTLDSFFLGGWPNADRNISYSIDDLATPGIDISVNAAFVAGSTGLVVTPALTSATGLRISFGPDGFNGGINNIAFSIAAVPEPESYLMLLAGLGLVGAIARRGARSRAAT
ncbi:MAG TPA: PEP-CTERM sorting domain-containing protein [Methyloversatilis sp.]